MKFYTRSDIIQDITWVENLIRRCSLENGRARRELIKDLEQEAMFFSFLGQDFLEFIKFSGDSFEQPEYQKELLSDLDLLKEFLRLHFLEGSPQTLMEYEDFKKQKTQYQTWIGKSFETYIDALCQSILEEKRKKVQQKQSTEIYEIEKLSREYDLTNQWDVDKLYEALNQRGEESDKTPIWEQFMDGLWENTTEKKENQKKAKAASRGMVFFVVMACLVLGLSAFLAMQIMQNRKMDQMLSDMKNQQNVAADSKPDSEIPTDSSEDSGNQLDSNSQTASDIPIDSTEADNSNQQENSNASNGHAILPELEIMYEGNKDLMGWIKIADTTIDYPVMQNTVDDAYYLSHNYFKEESSAGAIFLAGQSRISPLDNYLVIYGHNMKAGNMFGALNGYNDKSYLETHPTFEFDTLFEKNEYEIISVVRTRVMKEDEGGFRYYQFYGYNSEEEFAQIQEFVAQNELFNTGKQLEYGDEIVILSTCDYVEKNGRLLIVGVRK